MRHVPGAMLSRRRMLAACLGAVALPSVLGACTTGTGVTETDPAVLTALADQARADAALAVAAVTGDPDLAARLEPLRAARIEHAGALDAAARRATPPPAPPTGAEQVDEARVRDAVTASARAAANAAAGASVDRVGLIAEVFACCAAYGDSANLGSVTPPEQEGGQASKQIAVEALQRSLAGEHAAIWAYGLATAFARPDWSPGLRTGIEAHRQLRTTLTELLSRDGEKPVSAQPSYNPPQPVLDAGSAGALLVAAESDSMAACRSLAERASSPTLRIAALGWMSQSTVRSVVWRTATGLAPAVPVFPGRE